MSKHRRRMQHNVQQVKRARWTPAWDYDVPVPVLPERAPRYVPDDWRNAWATTTDRICTAVWRSQAYRLHPYNPQAREDLWDWLWVKACEFANVFTPKVIPEAEDHWAACLHAKLAGIVRWHWAEYYGATAYDDRDGTHHVASVDSIERLLEKAADGGARMRTKAERHTLWTQSPIAPERFVILMETATEHADGTSHLRKPAGTCIEEGCWEPVDGSRDWCRSHENRHRRLWGDSAGTPCSVQDCPHPAFSRGLCSTHYAAARREDPSRARCIEEGCEKAATGRQLCNTHREARRSQGIELPPKYVPTGTCTVEGCTRKADGICSTHRYRLAHYGSTELPPKATACVVEDCDRVVLAKGMCSTHYNQARRARLRQEAS